MSDDSTIRSVREIPEIMAAMIDLAENQQVLDVVILCRVTDFENGGNGLAMGISPGVDVIIQNGLILAAYGEMMADAAAARAAAA